MTLIRRGVFNLFGSTGVFHNVRFLSNKTAFITKVHRKMYLKLYETTMVQPNGATFTFRHHEPRRIIKLPVDFSTLSEEEKNMYLERRKPKKKVVIQDDIEDNFNSAQYLKLVRRN